MANLQEFYNNAREKGVIDPSVGYDAFEQAMRDEQQRQDFYQYATNAGLKIGTPERFGEYISAHMPQIEESQVTNKDPLNDERSRAFGHMADPLYSGQYYYHQAVADKQQKLQAEASAQLPISEEDKARSEEIRRMEIEGKWGKPNGISFGIDKTTGMPTITQTEGNGMHLYAGEQLANQDEIDRMKAEQPSYMKREIKTPQDLLTTLAEAWTANKPEGKQAMDDLNQEDQASYETLSYELDRQLAGLQEQLAKGAITEEEAEKQAEQMINDTQTIFDNERALHQEAFLNKMKEANPDYLAQQMRILGQKATNATATDINKQIAPRINQLMSERQQALQRARDYGYSKGGAYGALGSQISANTAYPREKDEELAMLQQAQQFLADAVKISEAAQKQSDYGFVEFGKGFGNAVSDIDTWDMGLSQVIRSANLKKVVEKYEASGKNPDSLTESERALMDAAVTYISACAYNSDKLSRMYKAGQSFGESVPFMLQFAVMPIASIKDKVAKGVLGYGIEQFGGKALQTAGQYTAGRMAAEAGTMLLGNLAATGAMTAAFGVPKIVEGTISRMTGDIRPDFDENGRIVYGSRENQQGTWEAAKNATVDVVAENLSEMIFTTLDPMKAYLGTTKLFKGLADSELAKLLSKLDEGWVGDVRKRTQIQNLFEEKYEEDAGKLIRWGLSSDVNSAEDAGFTLEENIDTWYGVAGPQLAFTAAGLGYHAWRGGVDKFRSSQAAKKLQQIMLNGEERKYLDELLKSRDSEGFKRTSHEVIKHILLNKDLTAQDKRYYLDNLYLTYQSQLAIESENEKIAEQVHAEVDEMTNKTNGYVYPVALASNNEIQGYIAGGVPTINETDPNNPRFDTNDEIVTVKLNDGRVVQLSTSELVLTGKPQSAQELFVQIGNERIEKQRIMDQSKGTFHQGDVATIQVPNAQTGETDEFASNIVSVSDEGVEVEVIDPTGQVSTTIIPHDVALQTLTVVNTQPAQAAEAPSAEQQTTGVQQAQPQAQTANMPVFVNGDENISVVDNQDGTYTNPATGEVVTREQMADKGYAFIAPQPAPAAPQVQSQQAGSNTANISETNPNDGVTKIEPNIFTASVEDYVRATVENKYKGNKAKAQANIAAKLNGAKTELQAAQREFEKFKNKGITSKMNSDQWDELYDQYERQIKGLTDLVSRLETANIAAAHYQTVAEQKAEAERKARAAAIREQRRQTQAAQLANSAPAERWNATPKVTGNAVTRTLPDGTVIRGHYVLTEAQAATPSHDPFNGWNTSNGFPTTEDGRNINDRDYLNDKDAQQITMQIAQTYDGQAVSQVPVVSSEGIVYDGNGRTIAGHIAAANNTDAAYIQALAENAANFGFTPEQVASMQHPRVYMQLDADLPYNTTTFAKFNAQEKKSQGSTNRAVSNSKKLTESARDGLLRILDNYATLDTFFASEVGANDVIKSLLDNNIITQQEVAGLIENTDKGFVLSTEGKNYITDLLIGALFDEQTIRMLGNDKGLKQSILRALPSIVENRRLGDYALTENINTAIKLLYEARQAGLAYKLYVRQGSITDGYVKDRYSAFDMLLAEEMSSGVETFRQVLNLYNNSARDEANNQEGLFEPRTPEDIKNEIVEYYGREEQPAESAEPAESGSGDTQTESPVSSTPASPGQEGVVLQSLREQAQAYSEKLGVPIVVFNGLDEIPESEVEARKRFEEIGNDVDAWYSPAAGIVFVNGNSPEILSEGGLQRKVFHEIVAHKGLRSLIGEQNFSLLCDYVWEAMSVDQRQQYYGYAYTNYNTRNEIELRRIAADEFMAFTAEQYTSLDTNDQSEKAQEVRTIWQKITDFIKNILNKILGGDYVSDDLLAELYKASFENLKRISITDREIGGALVDRLGDMGLNVSTDLAANRQALKEAKADKSDTGAIHYYKTPSGQQYGFSYKGRIYLDPTKIDAELPIHEYGHLWAEAMRRISPESWRSVVDTIKADQASWDFVRELRPELTDENEIAEEVIATFSGKRGAERLRAEYKKMHGKDADYKSKWGNIFQNISKAIQDFWKAVGDFLNIKYQSAEQIYDQVLKDFVENMNPYQKVRDFLRARDAEYIQAAESGDIQKATNIFYDALRENIGNGITPYMSVGTYLQFKRLAKGVKTRDAAIIREAAEKIAPLIPDNAVLVPTPSHTGRATDMLDLANAIAEITGSEVADILRSAPRESQYQAKKETGTPMASQQLGIMMEGTVPADKTAIVIDNVVDSGNTAEACIQALGKGVVVTLADSAEQYRHAASLRSAAPILRDKDGNIVPLTKRFNLNGSRYLGRRMYLRPDDPRFAISGTQVIPVGEKTLVGLHNISAEKLRKAIKMGGLANPSTAVINIASQNHEQYGDISLVMPSRLVDSKTGRNAGTFTGDIWSPTYPSVERVMSDKGSDTYYATITKAFGDNEARRPILSRAKLDFDDYLDRGNIRAGLAYWYLLEKGIEPGDVYYNSGISEDVKKRFEPLSGYFSNLSAEEREILLSIIADEKGTTVEQMKQDAQEAKARYQQTIDDPNEKQFRKNIAQKAIDEIDYYGVQYGILSNEYHRLNNAVKNDGTIDLDATLIAAQDIVQTQYQSDFERWLSDMDKRFDIKEVLFDGYNAEGDRIYKPHTLANASRMMNQEPLQNAGGNGGLSATRGQLVERMETLADIRLHKDRLRPGTEEDVETEEWNKMSDEWFAKILNPLSDMQKISDNPFSNVGYAESRLQEALTKSNPVAYLNKEYGYKIDPNGEWAKNLRDMVQRVKDLPTKYFETKFRRPVYLDEFANAVVPVGLPQDLRDGLTGAGMTLFEYDPAEQGSRRAATLKATADEGIRFSISSAKGSPSVARRGNLQYSEGVLPSVAKEMESIKNEAVNNGTFMQAPNGKPTNLTERQWLQVRLRSFKRWFGDWENDPQNASKVLDVNGEPRVVWHRTNNLFNQFDPDRSREQSNWPTADFGFYFSNVNMRGHYGKYAMPVFLNIRNPRTITVDEYGDFDYGYKRTDPEEIRKDNDGLLINVNNPSHNEADKHFVIYNPNQAKSAIGNDGSFSEENDDIRFSISNQNNDIFYSNAERAVEGIKQEKATPEQWRAMIEKAGGLKAGEDKWIGLSDWLAQQRPTVELQPNETRSQYIARLGEESKRFTISKQDILDYIREHKIQIEEQEYGEYEEDALFLERKDEFKRYYDEAVEAGEEDPNEVAWDRMIEEYGDDFSLGYYAVGDELMRDNDSDYAQWEADSEGRPRNINETRLRYTTWGLENKREIALIVPDIEEWNENDEIHFGDAGPGKAIAWVRFGDAHKIKYGENGEELADVLVIDEIQSKRHQEGREHGYVDSETAIKYRQLEKETSKAQLEYHDYRDQLWKKYENQVRTRGEMLDVLTPEEKSKHTELQEKYENLYDRWEEFKKNIPVSAIPAAPFEKNWHELAMKRILRFAAENGYDKVAWTTGDQQAARYNIGEVIDSITRNEDEDYPYSYNVMSKDHGELEYDFDENGIYHDDGDPELDGKSMSDVFGKELAKRLQEMPAGETIDNEGLRIGGEGMRGFYDDILPRFMQKYGKKWGVQVGEVTMPQLEDGYQTMHAIDINDAMRESVLEGQPMFSISGHGVNGTMKPQEGETRSQYIARVAETVKNMTPRNTTIDDAIRFSITVNHNSPYLLKRADGSFVDPETGERLGFDHRFMGKGEGGQAHGWGSYFSVNDIRSYGEGYGFSVRDIKDAFNTSRWQSFGVGDAFDVAKGYLLEAHSEKAPSLRKWLEDRLAQKQELLKNYEGKVANTAEEGLMVFRAEADVQYIPALLRDMVNDIDTRNRHHYDVEIPDNDGTNYFEEDQPLTQEQIDRLRKAAKETGIPKFLETISGFLRFAETNPEEYPFRKFYSDITDFQYGYPRETISNFLKDAGFVGIHYDGRRDGECYVIFDENDAVITDHIRFAISGRRVFGGNRGYVGYSKSVRAVNAEEEGKRSISNFDNEFVGKVNTLLEGVGAKTISLAEAKRIAKETKPDEWHHTSMYGNKTNYYSPETIAYAAMTDEQKTVYDAAEAQKWEKEHAEWQARQAEYIKKEKERKERSSLNAAEMDKIASQREEMVPWKTNNGYYINLDGVRISIGKYDLIELTRQYDEGVDKKVKKAMADKYVAELKAEVESEINDKDIEITDHIRFSINSGKQKIWIQWHEDNPHPKYEEGEGLDHYRERLERWEASFIEMRSKTKDMPESEPEQPKSEPQFETAEQKAEREEIYPSYMSPKEILEKAIALNSQRMSPDAVILRHNVINNMRKLREQIRRLREAEASEVGTITSEIEQGVRSRSVALRAEYEKSAKMITDIAKALFRGKVFQGMTDQDFSKMLTNIRDASTKFDLQKNIEIMEDIVQRVQGRYLRLSQEAVSQAANITLQRRNQSGVDIGKRVDPLHFVMISQFNALRNTDLTKIGTTLADLNSQIKEEISDTELEILSAKIAGAERAKAYLEELNRLQTDLDKIDSDIAQLDKYVSRNELKGNKRKEFMEHRRSLMSERAELIDELILLNDNTVEQLSSITRDGHSKFLERIQQKQEHKIEILRMMARDLHGIRSDEGAKEEDKGGLKDNYLSPLRTFTHELRKFGTHSAGGEGYLYSYFAPLAHDARTNYLLHIRERMEILDNKARELFGEKATWNSVMKSVSNQLTEVEYKWRNVGADNTTVNSAGVQKSVKKPKVKYLTNGQIMYIYMVNKMTDGKAKLEKMGIDDATVAELKGKLPKELVQLADWLQEEYFPMTRKRYNETNIYLFDTPMAEIANYVPLKISGNAIDPKVDVGTGDMHMLPSNIVGNAISRTYNKKPIDIENTDAMDLVVQNMLTMEHWSAYAELITDLNTLLNSASFKHRIEQMNPNNYDNFFKTAQLAVDQYKPEVGPADKFVTGLTRFVATSKISLRWWTALKQSLSAISPLSEADPEFHKQYANAILHSKDSFQWALENLPIFRERWEGKQGGNEKLNIAEINSKSKSMQDMLEWAQENLVKYGISANAFVDAIVCANMAKAQYEAKKKYYTERGYSPEAVERLAKWKADEIYNETQQSSEGAYISAMQRDRTFIASSISLFNNSSMAYNRKNAEAIREAYKIAVRDKQEFVEFRKEQLIRDGIAEDKAAKLAEQDYKRARTHAIADMAINGYFIQFVWNVGGKAFKTLLAVLPFLFFGDDDEKKRAKEELLADLKKDAIVTGIQPIRGLPFGASAEAFLNVVYDRLSDEENRRYMSTNEIAGRASSNIHPAIQDVSKLLSTLTKDEVDKLNFASYLVNLATSTGTSVDAQTVANELWALEDVIERSFHGKLTWSDIRNDVAILLNVPPSQIEYMILQPRKNETRDEFVQRYTEYVKLKKYGWFTPVVKTDDVELSNSQEDRVYNAFYNY